MARQLAQTHGADVGLVLAARNEAWLNQVAGQCATHGAQTFVVKTDVSIEPDCRHGQLMRINLWGSVWCSHAALLLLRQSRGSIVAVSSLAALVGVPGRTAYSASKFAMTGFFEALRAGLKDAGSS